MIGRVVVVSAAIVREGRVLLAQRAPEVTGGWSWCTPGGKAEPGESNMLALNRELIEEVGVSADTRLATLIYTRDFDPPEVRYPRRVICYRIEYGTVAGVPVCGDKTIGVGWFTADDLAHLPLAPADDAERAALISMLRWT